MTPLCPDPIYIPTLYPLQTFVLYLSTSLSTPLSFYLLLYPLYRTNNLTCLPIPILGQSPCACRWFGTSDDAVKLVEKLIVQADWHQAIRRTAYAKLLLLTQCNRSNQSITKSSRDENHADEGHPYDEHDEAHSSVPSLRPMINMAKHLSRLVLRQSGLFQGHGVVDLELRLEQTAWMNQLQIFDHSILLFDSILRVARHWNAEFCLDAQEATIIANQQTVASVLRGKDGARDYNRVDVEGTRNGFYHSTHSLLPYSPVLYCALNLAAMNFEVLASSLPRHIRIHASSSSSSQLSPTNHTPTRALTTTAHNNSTTSPYPSLTTSADAATTATTSALFMSKFTQSVCPLLHMCVVEVMTVVGLGVRYPGKIN